MEEAVLDNTESGNKMQTLVLGKVWLMAEATQLLS